MHLLKLILLFSLCIWLSAKAQTPYDSFAPETSRPILTSEALSKEKCAQDFSSDTTLLVAMIDRQQERILLVDMSNGSIVAYAPLTDNECHWLSPDPMLDKYPQISPYAYCHWNPMRYIDPDGRDDLFDESGIYLRHIDNGTDYIMIEDKTKKLKNIIDYDYSQKNIQNRQMLKNVATYYAAQINLNQDIEIYDNTTIEEGAFAATSLNTKQVSIVTYDGKLSSLANTGNNIMNAFVHETKHAIDGNTSETDAILQQIVHPTWNKTTASFQHGVINYLVNNANKKQLSVYNPSIKQIQSVLKQSAYSIFYHDGKFSILLQPR